MNTKSFVKVNFIMIFAMNYIPLYIISNFNNPILNKNRPGIVPTHCVEQGNLPFENLYQSNYLTNSCRGYLLILPIAWLPHISKSPIGNNTKKALRYAFVSSVSSYHFYTLQPCLRGRKHGKCIGALRIRYKSSEGYQLW